MSDRVSVSNPRGSRWWWLLRAPFLLAVAVLTVSPLAGAGAYIHFSRDLPRILTVEDYQPAVISRFYGADERLLGEFSIERRDVVSLNRMPAYLVEAFLAAEDKRFFSHEGVDLRATLRAVLANYLAGKTVQGASTITQQLCKSLVGRQRSYERKIREAILARRTEQVLGKLDILFLYLNEIYLGHGAHGVQEAARAYFGKDVEALNLAEAAMLAGLPPQPSRLNPVRDFEGSKKRQAYVLARMVEEGFIEQAAADAARAMPLDIRGERRSVFHAHAPHYVEHARKIVQKRYGYDALNEQGLRVELAVNIDAQRAAQESLSGGLHQLGERQGFRGPLKSLKQSEISDFIKKSTSYYNGPGTLVDERWYLGVVTNTKRRSATVQVGDVEADLPLREGMRWAKPYDEEAEDNKGTLGDVRKALKTGDVIIVRRNRSRRLRKNVTPALALGQIPPLEGALISMSPWTGYVNAMVGGFDFDQSEYNRAFQGCRQPGSIFKPIVYSKALAGEFTLATPLDDTPIVVYDRKERYIWKPRNFGGDYRGHVLFRDAFIRSMNIPAVRVIRAIGPEAAVEWATRLGVSTPMYPDQSLVLGASCVYPWEMVQVYGLFAARGRKSRPVFIKRVENRNGQILEDHTHFSDLGAPFGYRIDGALRTLFEPHRQLLADDTAYLMQTALKQVVDSGTAVAARTLKRPIGGKTGTTDAYDAWFVGFSDEWVTGVWVGSDRNRRRLGRGETGGKVALPIWKNYMGAILDGWPVRDFLLDPPGGIEFHGIDQRTGLLAAEGNQSLKLPFKQGTQPKEIARQEGELDNQQIDLLEGSF